MSFLSKFKVCLFCGSLKTKSNGFCGYCFEQISLWSYSPRHLVVKGIKVRPLFLWNEMTGPWLKHLIYSLKQGGAFSEQQALAKLFLKNFVKEENIIFVCAPGKDGDHAHEWASSICEILDAEYVSPFIKTGSKQKEKNREQREKASFKLKDVQNLEIGKKNKVVFFDDVLATGNTASQCLNLIAEHSLKEVWCICYKEYCPNS